MSSNKKYLRRLPCDKCGSSDGKQEIEEDGHIHYHCFVCGEHTDSRSVDSGYTHSTSGKVNPLSLPFAPLKSRGIRQDVAEQYGVRTEFAEDNGEEAAYWYPRTKGGSICGWQVRRLPKTFTSTGDVRGAELFGQSLCGNSGKLLIITEGNDDCLAVKQLLLEQGKNYRVVSLPSGANSKSISDNLEWLESFESIVLCFDQDDAGRKCSEEVASILSPGKALIARYSEKDGNEMLRKGKGVEMLQAINNARPFRPDGIVSVEDILEEAITPPQMGSSWPWPTLSRLTYGRRRREMYGFAAGTGSGKTEAFKEVIQHIVEVDQLPVGVFFLEEPPSHTLKVLAGKLRNKRFHVPDGDWTVDELKEAVESLREKVYLYNHFGQKDWATIKSKIRYMVKVLGIKDIFLDHLTAIVAEASDVNKELERVMADMATLTQELDFTLYFVSHLTTPAYGPSHEEGGRVTSAQLRGSRTVAYWSHFLFGLERDQQAEDEFTRNKVLFRVLKDRYTGFSTGHTFDLYYDHNTGRFLEEIVREF